MGRLEIQIRHGDSGPPWPVIALLALIVLAAAGGVGGKAASHVVAFVELAALVIGALVIVAAAAVITIAVARSRAARAARGNDTRPPVVTLAPRRDYGTVTADGRRPALDAPRPAAPGWPLDDRSPDEIPAPAGDRRRSS